MQTETHDQIGYRIAVAAIGIALIVALAGICVIVAVGEGSNIPKEMWSTVSALGGGLLGLLAPSPTPATALAPSPTPKVEEKAKRKEANKRLPNLRKAMSVNFSVVILLLVFAVAVLWGALADSTQLQALAAGSGAALIGLLAPSPAKKQDPAGPRQPLPGAKPREPEDL